MLQRRQEGWLTTTLVLGGARSGKSTYSPAHVEKRQATISRPQMIVTAQALDDEMRNRVARHQADRDDRWTTLEAPADLVQAISSLSTDDVAGLAMTLKER